MGIRAYQRGSAAIARHCEEMTQRRQDHRDRRDIVRRFMEGSAGRNALELIGYDAATIDALERARLEAQKQEQEPGAQPEPERTPFHRVLDGEAREMDEGDLRTVWSVEHRSTTELRARRLAVAELRRRRRVKRMGEEEERQWSRRAIMVGPEAS